MKKITPTELTRLREYFDANGVSYKENDWEDNRYNLHVDLEYVTLSFLTSDLIYGGTQGLIELYNFKDEPTGCLTADEAIEMYERVAQE